MILPTDFYKSFKKCDLIIAHLKKNLEKVLHSVKNNTFHQKNVPKCICTLYSVVFEQEETQNKPNRKEVKENSWQ